MEIKQNVQNDELVFGMSIFNVCEGPRLSSFC